MRIVPAGRFTMGAPADLVNRLPWTSQIDGARLLWESPEVAVTIAKPFALGVFEVTRDQFEAFVTATNHQIAPGCTVWAGNWNRENAYTWTDPGIPHRGDHPVVCIDWHDAHAYAAWLTRIAGREYRLPSEAEWEYAYRAGTQSTYWWGEDGSQACEFGNVSDATLAAQHPARAALSCDDGALYTAPVGMRKPNPWGFYDMLGNAWEWVADCWTTSHATLPADGSPVTKGFCEESPLRGGAYGTGPLFTRASARGGPDDRKDTRQSWIGFRVAAAAEKAAP
jgi:formylglycine-generating enzyme required for sulfatase activity